MAVWVPVLTKSDVWDDGEGAGAVDGGEAVLLEWAGAPAVDAAHAAVLAVESEHGVG